MRALGEFLRRGLVGGRFAADRSRDVQIFQLEPVVAVGGVGLAGESGFMQHGEHKLAGGIAREWASGAIGAVRAGSQSHDEHPRLGIAEAGHGLAPVLVVAISAALLASHLLAVGDETWAAGAGDHFLVEYGKPAMLWSGFGGHDFKNIIPPLICVYTGSAPNSCQIRQIDLD